MANLTHTERELQKVINQIAGGGRANQTTEAELQQLLDRIAKGSGYSDPDARRDDDRRLQVLLAQEQFKIGHRLNRITVLLVVAALLNAAVLAWQVFGAH